MVPDPTAPTDPTALSPSSTTSPRTSPREFLAAREARRRQQVRDRLATIRAALPDAATALQALGASRIWVFGSVADGTFEDGSDLDLATEGLPPESFFAARAAVGDLIPVELDLIELERAPSSLRALILNEGQELSATSRHAAEPSRHD